MLSLLFIFITIIVNNMISNTEIIRKKQNQILFFSIISIINSILILLKHNYKIIFILLIRQFICIGERFKKF